MIREYAVEPLLLLDRRMCRALTESFGVSRGRLISRFPDHWEDLVEWALADARPVQKSRIIEAISQLRTRMVPRSHEWYGSGYEDWLEEAEREDQSRSFSAIIATSNPRGSNRVLLE